MEILVTFGCAGLALMAMGLLTTTRHVQPLTLSQSTQYRPTQYGSGRHGAGLHRRDRRAKQVRARVDEDTWLGPAEFLGLGIVLLGYLTCMTGIGIASQLM